MKRAAVVLLCGSVLLSGCQETLFGKLTEREANEVVASLGEVKINASKKNVKDDIWSVLVERSDFDTSVRVLGAAGIPNASFSGLQETFKRQGLASSPTEERARLMFAQSQELEKSIRVIDCVVTARVHVNIPTPDRFATAGQESTVSILVKHRPNCALESIPNQLKSLAVNAVENTRAELVSVMLTPALDFSSRVSASKANDHSLPFIPILGSVFSVVGIVGILGMRKPRQWIVNKFSRNRRNAQHASNALGSASATANAE